MNLIQSSWGATRASISRPFTGAGHVIKAGAKKIKLPSDIAKSQVTMTQNEMTGGRMLLIILLGLTVVGLLLAIPMFFAGKKKRVVIAFKTNDGETLSVAATNNAETKMLQLYSGIGVFE